MQTAFEDHRTVTWLQWASAWTFVLLMGICVIGVACVALYIFSALIFSDSRWVMLFSIMYIVAYKSELNLMLQNASFEAAYIALWWLCDFVFFHSGTVRPFIQQESCGVVV
eukprot:SAG31_NODE_532_length_14374_cov_30.565254_8_plen_111_part_00